MGIEKEGFSSFLVEIDRRKGEIIMLEFIYKGEKYSWEEWHNEKKEFIKSLELPDDLSMDWALRDWSIAYDVGYSIAIEKFMELYKLIASARSSLINSFDKFYDSSVIEWGSNYKAHIWMRGEYLKNSIVWYNSCEDYIYQILWFAYDMSGEKITSAEDYEKQLKKVCYKNIKSKLVENNSNEAKELLKYIDEYRFDEEVRYLRDGLANNLKHRGHLTFRGIEDTRLMGFKKLDKEKNIIFSSEWVEPKIVDIDETIELLKNVHVKLIKLARDIKDFINFDDMFERTEDGKIKGNIIKDKASYKKIIFNKS